MGGPVPLGYDVRDRKLVVNEAEAEIVRLIFERHQSLGTIQALAADLELRRIVSKRRVMRDGREAGGTHYSAGALTHLLRNVLYTGRVTHHGTVYPGEHDEIIEESLGAASQALLDRSAPRPRTGRTALLAGMIENAFGRAMTPAHANRGGRRYLYYVSRQREGQVDEVWRLPAADLDAIVTRAVLALLRDPLLLTGQLTAQDIRPHLVTACAELADKLGHVAAMRAALVQLDATVIVGKEMLEITLGARALATLVGADGRPISADHRIATQIETSLKRRGHELRLVYAAPEANPAMRDDRPVQLIASGHAAYDQLLAGKGKPSTTERSHLVRLARLRFLTPTSSAQLFKAVSRSS